MIYVFVNQVCGLCHVTKWIECQAKEWREHNSWQSGISQSMKRETNLLWQYFWKWARDWVAKMANCLLEDDLPVPFSTLLNWAPDGIREAYILSVWITADWLAFSQKECACSLQASHLDAILQASILSIMLFHGSGISFVGFIWQSIFFFIKYVLWVYFRKVH